MKFGEALKSARKAKKFKQTELAKLCHVSQGTIANWETGARTPDAETIAMVADILGVTVDSLIREPGAKPTYKYFFSRHRRTFFLFVQFTLIQGLTLCKFTIFHEMAQTHKKSLDFVPEMCYTIGKGQGKAEETRVSPLTEVIL